jgi:S1-C subfamily serine protease
VCQSRKAGLKVGDVITAVDGKAAVDPETFRRLLRHGTVLEETKFAVKRDGKEITVTASFLGWEPPVIKTAK